jgi:HSP20 family protein
MALNLKMGNCKFLKIFINNKNHKVMSLVRFKKNNAVLNPFFDDIFGSEWLDNRPGFNTPSANVKETENKFEIELAVPGFEKSEVKVELNDKVLTISSEREEKNEEKDEKFSRREFKYSSFSRSFRLPENVQESEIKANFKNGVLSIEIPKAIEVKKVKSIEIS